MKKILGLDLGTNSIGWALICENEEKKEKHKAEHKKSEKEKYEDTINELGIKLAETNDSNDGF